MKNNKKRFQKLPKKSLEKGNEDSILKGRHKYKFGEVLIAYDKKLNSPKKPWYLYYTDTKFYTGGFETKKKAIEWYEKKGR